MHPYTILCVDDEREVLDSVMLDLAPLSTHFELEAAESVVEAQEVIEALEAAGGQLALILCDHMMPGTQGVDFLIDLQQGEKTRRTRKILLTGQAGLSATIEAVNKAGLDYYISKPWTSAALLAVTVEQLTHYMIAYEPELLTYVAILDGTKIFQALHRRGLGDR